MVQIERPAGFVAVVVQVINSVGVEEGGAALDAMHCVALVEQEFGEVGAVLTGDAGDEGDFVGVGCHFDGRREVTF